MNYIAGVCAILFLIFTHWMEYKHYHTVKNKLGALQDEIDDLRNQLLG